MTGRIKDWEFDEELTGTIAEQRETEPPEGDDVEDED